MSQPPVLPAPAQPGTPVRRRGTDFTFQIVRARDLRWLRANPHARFDVDPTRGHGYPGDPRYPSPTVLRMCIAFTVDLLVHAGAGAGVWLAFERVPKLAVHQGAVQWLAAIGTFLVLSFVHRVFVQRLGQATLGKALTGLRLIQRADGRPMRLSQLVGMWFIGVLVLLRGLWGVISVIGEIVR